MTREPAERYTSDGRYRIAPAGPEQAREYAAAHLACLRTAYEQITGPGFGRRIAAEADDVLAEDRAYLQAPGSRAVMAWENPGYVPGDPVGCCALGADPDLWHRPVGVALSTEGPQGWEREVGAQPLAGPDGAPPRTLVNLYLLPDAQNQGLGSAMLDEVLDPEEPAYLWIIEGNDRAEAFYARRGFRAVAESYAVEGAWAPGRTRRLVRGLG